MERESIEWNQCYYFDTEKKNLPRILLIGDSIVVQYREKVAELLKDRATVTAFSTSKIAGDPALYKELQAAMADYPVSAVYFNNGLHGLNYDDAFYRRGLLNMVDFLQNNCRAKLFWRSSTPITLPGQPELLDPVRNAIVIRRNLIARDIMKQNSIPVHDLYQAVQNRPELSRRDGFHYNDDGAEFLAQQVTEFLKKNFLA